MSYVYICDYCGENIEPDDHMSSLNLDGRTDYAGDNPYIRSQSISGWIGHYHSSAARPCWWRIRDAIVLTQSTGPSLEQITTLSGQAVAARRRKHRKGGA